MKSAYEVLFDTDNEQYRYVVEASSAEEARDVAYDLAIADGYNGLGVATIHSA